MRPGPSARARRPASLPDVPRFLPVSDFDGLYFTIQANRLIHRELMDDVEFLVLDNHPYGGSVTKAIRSLLAQVKVPRGKYIGVREGRSGGLGERLLPPRPLRRGKTARFHH